MVDYSNPVAGIAGGYTGNSLAVEATIVGLLSCALFGVLELMLAIFSTFHVYRGLYFWSLLVSAGLGVLPQSLGLLLKYFELAPIAAPVTLSTAGWAIMVTGQSLVLYSRLHLVVQNRLVLRLVLGMIVFDALVLQIPQIVFSYGAVFVASHGFLYAYNIWAKVQLTGFFLQEVIISTVFIVQATRLLQAYPRKSVRRTSLRYQLLAINSAIIVMDIALLVLEYLDLFILQTVLKTFFYMVKLKLEFAVLSRLVSMVNHHDPLTLTDSGF
ncbi:hypothetical protein ASPZODRAFT_135983 [Penicilliopsis zonata CBS 506.65]|uniref:DUF7703 domain-containing protein n=1 Tax=Penicilliopsis zonata CBS 506.65 TaxID=1073090 RepID=A0A1L9S8N8_9EURO|nr:hypothetical protein ASPZODRAFT_135983 [Penicilliopsis zonata CBS 506.65]OJJ43526.1 hypothetical protein ASPZODRAFT_135983 [Penicilliopsis zonata CBS 506.65]